MNWHGNMVQPLMYEKEYKISISNNNGIPADSTYKLLYEIDNSISDGLKDFEGSQNIGRQTTKNVREIYFACKDFQKPSKVLHKIQRDYADQLEISYDIYK